MCIMVSILNFLTFLAQLTISSTLVKAYSAALFNLLPVAAGLGVPPSLGAVAAELCCPLEGTNDVACSHPRTLLRAGKDGWTV